MFLSFAPWVFLALKFFSATVEVQCVCSHDAGTWSSSCILVAKAQSYRKRLKSGVFFFFFLTDTLSFSSDVMCILAGKIDGEFYKWVFFLYSVKVHALFKTLSQVGGWSVDPGVISL